jgi:hypothetical protein
MEQTVDIVAIILNSINSVFSNIFSSVDNNIYGILDEITFIDSKIIEKENFIKIFGQNPNSGILLVCNSLILGIILIYVIHYLFSHITYSKVQTPMQFILKAIIFVGLMNGSYWICCQIINIISLISKSICEIGRLLFEQEITFSNFIVQINNRLYSSGSNIEVTSFDGIIKTFTTMGFMSLIFSYSLRYIMIQVFVLFMPFGFLCIINEKTLWVFKTIMRAFISLLLEQVLVSVILVLAFSFSFSSSDLISKVLFIGIIYSLMKANTYMYMIFGGITTSVSSGIGMMTNKNL